MFAHSRLWEAAERNGFRGHFYFPTLDAGQQLPEWTREIISGKINWLYNNVGYIRAIIDGLALDEVANGIWPKAATSSRSFNKAATDRFHEAGKDPRFFDSRKIETAYSSQVLIRRHIRLHGELFGQHLRSGEGRPFPTQHFIPAWQIANRGDEPADTPWCDGILPDELGAAVSYRVIIDKEKKISKDVPAEDMMHFHDQFWVGQKRGTSGLAAMARKLFTLRDIEAAVANGIQLRSLVAYAIERKEGDTGGPFIPPGSVGSEVIENPDGSKTLVHKIVDEDGLNSTVIDPPAGRSVKVVESNAASEPFAFKTEVLRDLAHCTLYPPEYVFNLAGLSQGTLVRLTMQRVKTVKDYIRENQLIPQYLEPLYRFRLWQDIQRGFFAEVPADWYRVKWICPADTTVDIGREGRLYDERVATNKMSIEDYFGMGGKDRADVDDENLDAIEDRYDRLAERNAIRTSKGLPLLTYDQVWPANTQAAANAAAQPSPAVPADDEDDSMPALPTNRLNGAHL